MLLYIGAEVKPLDHQGKYFHEDIYINWFKVAVVFIND